MPKFPDILLNNNPDAPSLNLNDLQVKGVGIFADATERDALNSNLHTEGYLAIMKDTDTPFIYTGGTWTDAANWAEVKGLWDEDGLGIKYTTTGGSVAILDSTRPYQGNVITQLFGSSQSAPGGRASRKLLHLHEGQLIFSTETNTAVSHIEMSNQQHSSAVGGAIGTSTYNMRIHGYHALEFTHGNGSFSAGSPMVSMDMPSSAANTGSIGIGTVGNSLGGINLPSFGPSTVNTTNYSISMGGRIIFKNHSNIVWDAITQGPGGYAAAGVSLSSPNSSDILTAVSSDSTTAGSYGYVGINSYSPSAGGPAFEVSSSYGKFNDGLHIGDITATGYAFPTATGTTGQILKVDANGDLVFGDDLNGLWTSDTNGITYAGHVGIDKASDATYPLTVGGGAKIGGKLELYSNTTQTTGNILISFGSSSMSAAAFPPLVNQSNILIGGQITSTSSSSIIIGYNVTGSGQDLVIGSSTYHSRAVIGGNPGSIGTGSVGIYKAAAASYAVAIGQASNASATGGIAIGNQSLSGNGVAIGNRAGLANITGNNGNVNIGTNAGHRYYNPGGQDFNHTVNIGYEAGRSMAYNTSINGLSVNIGYQTGYFAEGGDNVMIGYRAGYGVDGTSTGSGNVFLGKEAGYSETGSNKLYISNSSTTTPLIYGEFDNYHVKFNGTYAGGAIGFFPQNSNTNSYVAIGDQNYFSAAVGTTQKGLFMIFDSTFASVGGYASGFIMGHSFNLGSVGTDSLLIGNRMSSTATNTQATPKIIIGNGVDLGSTTNNAGGIIIGASITDNIGSGVVIGGTGGNFNGVAIKATGHANSQGGTAILGQARGYNVAIGTNSGTAGLNGTASQATLIGNAAAQDSNATVAIGGNAARSATGSYVTAVGLNAFGDAVATGSANTAVGQSAGQKTTGSSNTFIGALAAASNTTGNGNVAIGGGLGAGGAGALVANTTGSNNIAIGGDTLKTAVSASTNIAIGRYAGYKVGGSSNIFLGYRTAYAGTDDNTSIANNVVIGYEAGYNLASGYNVIIGSGAGRSHTTIGKTVAIGYNAGNRAETDFNTLIGYSAGEYISNAAGPNFGQNTALGHQAMQFQEPSYAIAIGFQALRGGNSDSGNVHVINTAIGNSALYNITTGASNIAIGQNALYDLNTGAFNIAFGTDAGPNITTGQGNIAIGEEAMGTETGTPVAQTGDNNIAIGYKAGEGLTTATESIYIGRSSGRRGAGYAPTPGVDGTTDYAFVLKSHARYPALYGNMNVNPTNPVVAPGFMRSMNFQQEWNNKAVGAVDANQMYYVTNNTVAKADASSAATATGLLVFTLGSNLTDDSAVMTGHVSHTITGLVGDKVYLSTTPGILTTTPPSGSGEIVRVVGYITHANQVYLTPSTDWVEI